MTEVLTSAQMRATERSAINSGSVTGATLMERAGQGTVAAVLARWPALASTCGTAVILCGPGNNGGDGFVIARHLRERGWTALCYLGADVDGLPRDARLNYDLLGGKDIRPLADLANTAPDHVDLWVDALFGTGLARPITDTFGAALSWLGARTDGRKIAVDIASGIDADTGASLGGHLPDFDLTVTFHRSKRGHYLAEGPAHCGALDIVDIGLTGAPDDALRLTAPDMRCFKSAHGSHKYDHGHALIIGGGRGHSGAARMAARAALRAGAGLVTIAVPSDALDEYAAQVTSIMLRVVDTPAELASLLDDRRYDRICIGPACGIDRAATLLPVVLATRRKTVIDADAITALARDPDLQAMLHGDCVLTPHGGEFGRLCPDLANTKTLDKITATEAASVRFGCTILYKGPDTIIATPNRVTYLNDGIHAAPAPWLATAGSGDVLAGIITALDDVPTAAWLHTAAARHFGPGLIAEDLPDQIPAVYRSLGL